MFRDFDVCVRVRHEKNFPRIPFIVGDGVARRKMVGHYQAALVKHGCIYCLYPTLDQSVPYNGMLN